MPFNPDNNNLADSAARCKLNFGESLGVLTPAVEIAWHCAFFAIRLEQRLEEGDWA
jgi:hypothetical protein